jgi:hypothetical protein
MKQSEKVRKELRSRAARYFWLSRKQSGGAYYGAFVAYSSAAELMDIYDL